MELESEAYYYVPIPLDLCFYIQVLKLAARLLHLILGSIKISTLNKDDPPCGGHVRNTSQGAINSNVIC